MINTSDRLTILISKVHICRLLVHAPVPRPSIKASTCFATKPGIGKAALEAGIRAPPPDFGVPARYFRRLPLAEKDRGAVYWSVLRRNLPAFTDNSESVATVALWKAWHGCDG